MYQKNKKNYVAWNILEEDFPRSSSLYNKLLFILNYAILSPSAHNTQPWLFEIKNGIIYFYIDNKRALVGSDESSRQLYESLETIKVAGYYFGFEFDVSYQYNDKNKKDSDKELFCSLYAKECSIDTENIYYKLFKNIIFRYSGKLKYENIEVDDKFLEEAGKLLFNFDDLNLKFVKVQGLDRNTILSAIEEGTRRAFAMQSFKNELGSWLRNNWTKKFDGMPGFTVGMPAPISLLAPKLFTLIDTSKMQISLMKDIVNSTPVIGLISGVDCKENWIKSGQLYVLVSLLSCNYEFSTHVMGAAVEFDDIAYQLSENLNINGKPLMFFRIGRQKKKFLSPRRLLTDVLI